MKINTTFTPETQEEIAFFLAQPWLPPFYPGRGSNHHTYITSSKEADKLLASMALDKHLMINQVKQSIAEGKPTELLEKVLDLHMNTVHREFWKYDEDDALQARQRVLARLLEIDEQFLEYSYEYFSRVHYLGEPPMTILALMNHYLTEELGRLNREQRDE